MRHYRFSASAEKKTYQTIRHQLGQSPHQLPDLPEKEPFTCHHCGGELKYLREIPRLGQLTRGPPRSS